MPTPLFRPTIEDAFIQFLDDQRTHSTQLQHTQYEDVLEHFRQFLEQEGHESLPEPLRARWTTAVNNGETFIQTFHTPQILPAVTGFFQDLTYQKSLLPPAVTNNAERVLHLLARWLLAQELCNERDYLEAMEGLPQYRTQLESAEQLGSVLFDFAREEPPGGKIFDEVKGYAEITKVHRGSLILRPLVQNHLSAYVRVPQDASALARTGWWIDLHMVQTSEGWLFVDVGSVLP
ncbi:MAG: hypothetical protein ACKO6N_01320 [Myxococcota bacterium]